MLARSAFATCALVVALTGCERAAAPPIEVAEPHDPAPPTVETPDLTIDRGLPPSPPPPPRACDTWYELTRIGPRPVDMTLVVEASRNLDDALPAPARHWSAVAGAIHDFAIATTSVDTISLVIAGDAHDPRTTYPSAVDVPRAPLDGATRAAIDARLATTPAVDVTVDEVLGPVLPRLLAEPLSVPAAKKVLVYLAARNVSLTDANALFLAKKELAPEPVFGVSLDPSTAPTPVFDMASTFKFWCGPTAIGPSCPPPSTLVTDQDVRSAISAGLERAARWAHAVCRFLPPPLPYPDEASGLWPFDELGRALDGEWSWTRDDGWSVELDAPSCARLETTRAIEGYLRCPNTP